MTDAPTPLPSAPPPRTPGTVWDVMRPKATTVEPNDHVAAAAYLMKHAGVTALVIVDAMTGQQASIVAETDVTHAVADGKNLDDVRIHDLMTTRPVVIDPAISISDAARAMTGGRFRHLPVVGDDGLIGIVDITDVCRALLDPDATLLAATGTARTE